MSRSLYKPHFLDRSLISNVVERQLNAKNSSRFINIINKSVKVKKLKNVFLTFKRGSRICRYFLDKNIGIYNGSMFQPLYVTENHINFRIGDFSLTRRTPNRVKKKIATKGKNPKFRPAKFKTKSQILRYSFKLNVRKIKEKTVKHPDAKAAYKERAFVISRNKKKPKVWNKKTYNWKKRKGKLYHK